MYNQMHLNVPVVEEASHNNLYPKGGKKFHMTNPLFELADYGRKEK